MTSVATAVGVSLSTVSNAYNKPEQLSADVRERIFAAARELGYPGPDAAARTLRSRRAGAIGLLLTEQLSYAFSDPFAVGLLAGLAEVAERTRTGLLLIPLPRCDTIGARLKSPTKREYWPRPKIEKPCSRSPDSDWLRRRLAFQFFIPPSASKTGSTPPIASDSAGVMLK